MGDRSQETMGSIRTIVVVIAATVFSCTDILIGGASEEAGTDTDVDTDMDTDTDTDGDADSDADGDTDTDTDTDIDTDTDSDSDSDGDTDADADTDSDSESSLDSVSGSTDTADTESDSESEEVIEECEPSDTYDSLGKVCYVDSVNGKDTNSGLSEDAPFKTQAAIPATCQVVRFKRGSRFNDKLRLLMNTKVYTDYGDESDPLPKFVVPSEPMSGPVVQAAGITLDSLYFAGARGDGTIENVQYGICLFLGADSKVLHCEITDCDIGAMFIGAGAVFQGNYVHDLILGVDTGTSGDPNMFGGAEGVFINASNIEVSYNTFVNCAGIRNTGSCDGGATEVIVPTCATVSGIKIHHNFSYNNCGLLEIGTGVGECKGVFRDSQIYNNVTVDSAWMGFLQVNNTDFENIHYYNNTSLQREGSMNAGQLWIIYTGTSSGMNGGDLLPGTVALTDNLFVFDGVTPFKNLIDENFDQTANLVIKTGEQDPGFSNIQGTTPEDFDLTAASPAIDSGSLVEGNTLDFMNRAIPDPNGVPDVGAYEYGSSQETCLPPRIPK